MGCTKCKRNGIYVSVPNSKKIVPFSRQLVLELGSRSHCITPTPKCNDHVNWIQIGVQINLFYKLGRLVAP